MDVQSGKLYLSLEYAETAELVLSLIEKGRIGQARKTANQKAED